MLCRLMSPSSVAVSRLFVYTTPATQTENQPTQYTVALRRAMWDHSPVLLMCQINSHSDLPLPTILLYTLSFQTFNYPKPSLSSCRPLRSGKLCHLSIIHRLVPQLVLRLSTTFSETIILVSTQATQAHSAWPSLRGWCNEYWWWLRPPMGKKRRVMRNSGPHNQDCWHTELLCASLIGSEPCWLKVNELAHSLCMYLLLLCKMQNRKTPDNDALVERNWRSDWPSLLTDSRICWVNFSAHLAAIFVPRFLSNGDGLPPWYKQKT